MQSHSDRFFVITGGPGSGKSSLIHALRQQGYASSIEAGRAIIRDQVSISGRALPWDDRALFAELMLCWEMRNYHLAEESNGIVFFDRGVPDVLGYLRLTGLAISEHMQNAVASFRYNHRAFIAPAWPEIFTGDLERKQSLDEAVRTYQSMASTYTELGYELIELPRVTIDERAAFVLEMIRQL